MKTFVFFLFVFSFLLSHHLFAQEILNNDAQAKGSRWIKNNTVSSTQKSKAKSTYKKPLKLPFFDDFIQSKNYPFSTKDMNPNDSLWINSGALVNNDYPINPPSYGCITLDGLADSGKAYTYVPFAFGGADTISSQHINLFNLFPKDSVFFSFFYQPEGHGDYPDIGDSLVLEFKNKNSTWIKIWSVDGFSSDPLPAYFSYIILPLTDSLFFDSLFQFRFRNIATISGNNDHWNIDYVKLNKSRTYNDATSDFSFSNIPTNPLLNYFSMPFKQFKPNKSAEMASSFKCEIFNNWNVSGNLDYRCNVYDGISGDTIKKYNSLSNNVNANSFVAPQPSYTPIYTIPDTLTQVGCRNSIVKEKFSFKPPNGENNQNDTFNYLLKFSNYLAYDDGTAEKVYGVLGNDAALAYEFALNTSDTLKAIQIHFAHMNADVSSKLFDLKVWSSIDIPNGVLDVQIQKETFLKPIYVDSTNGWATYPLDTVQILPSGKFYIGFTQLQADYLNIGFDVNDDAHTHLYVNTGLGWFPSIINGALMMRPLFGSCVPLGTFINDVAANQIQDYKLYPNPATHTIVLQTNNETVDEIKIYDIMGREFFMLKNNHHSTSNTIDIEKLEAGIYVIKALNYTNGKTITTKFIKE
ncbi:MAG: hypothetical protein RJA07_1433 [Bacteroidota bacterium]